MRRRQACLLLLAMGVVPPIWGSRTPASVEERVAARQFPSVFQAWNSADNLPAESVTDTAARHDLLWNVPEYFGLQWDNPHRLLADRFVPGSLSGALQMREALLARNPAMVLLAEVRWHDAPAGDLPDTSSWWQRDSAAQRMLGWPEGGQFLLNWHSSEFRAHVAEQASAVASSGVADGVLLDWWSPQTDDPDRLALLQQVRAAVGPDAIIMVNSGPDAPETSAPYINGLYMETTIPTTGDRPDDWRKATATLMWAEASLRQPTLNAFETWTTPDTGRAGVNRMRATTTLVLTHSDGYALFADANDLPTPDHLHAWYPFWDRSLGRPLGSGAARSDGAVEREFESGTALYNPIGNQAVAVAFTGPRVSAATGERAATFVLGPLDGDLYLSA